MRHSDINLTLKYYTHILVEDKALAIDKIPEWVPVDFSEVAKTGTDDVPESGPLYGPFKDSERVISCNFEQQAGVSASDSASLGKSLSGNEKPHKSGTCGAELNGIPTGTRTPVFRLRI